MEKIKDKLVISTQLKLFQHSESKSWGLTHDNSISDDMDGFDPFWDGIGIFHDVFEHYFEDKHEYFRQDAAFNVGGEIAAMGHALYYYEILGLYRRMIAVTKTPHLISLIESTESMMEDSISYGNTRFGDTLISDVPTQDILEHEHLEKLFEDKFHRLQEIEFKGDDSDEEEKGNNYRESCTLDKIQNLYRWGITQAEKVVPHNINNIGTLYSFIEFWKEFTESVTAEEFYYEGFEFINIKVYQDSDEEIYWTAELEHVEIDNYIIDSRENFLESNYWNLKDDIFISEMVA